MFLDQSPPCRKLGRFLDAIWFALMAGTMDKVKGSVKDALGRATGNTRLQAEGKTDKAKGHAADVADRVSKGADKVSDAAKGVKDSLKK
jgi:uncharacterized protein YjbJ (UPF0337 family)